MVRGKEEGKVGETRSGGRLVIVRAGDFDGGDDDIIEFDAEDAELDDDVELDELDDILEPSSLISETGLLIETTLVGDEAVEPGERAATAPGAAMPEEFRIDESQFHHIPLYSCDFFVRRAPDSDEDVYDFSEIYVAAPGSSSLSTPSVHGVLPTQARRCTLSEWTYVTGKTMPYSTDPYHASAKEILEVTKVFLTRHFCDERASSPHFVLDFEEIYVLDGNERSIRRANVLVDLPEGQERNRRNEMLIVRDDGTSFRIIRKEEQRHVDDVIAEFQWHSTRDSVESYLRGFRDFEKSNWF